MIYSLPQPSPDGYGFCHNCVFLEELKDVVYNPRGYCHFLKMPIVMYGEYGSECDLYDDCY